MIGPRHDRDAARIDWFQVVVLALVLVLGFVAAAELCESEFWRLLP